MYRVCELPARGDRLLQKQMSWPYILLRHDSVGLSKWREFWWLVCRGTNGVSRKESTACSDPAPPKASRRLMHKKFLQQFLIPVPLSNTVCVSEQLILKTTARQARSPRGYSVLRVSKRGGPAGRAGRPQTRSSRGLPPPSPPALPPGWGSTRRFLKPRGGLLLQGGGGCDRRRGGRGRERGAGRGGPFPASAGGAGPGRARRCGRAGSAIGAEPRRSGGRAVNGAAWLAGHRLPSHEGDTGMVTVSRAPRDRAMWRRGKGHGSCLPFG